MNLKLLQGDLGRLLYALIVYEKCGKFVIPAEFIPDGWRTSVTLHVKRLREDNFSRPYLDPAVMARFQDLASARRHKALAEYALTVIECWSTRQNGRAIPLGEFLETYPESLVPFRSAMRNYSHPAWVVAKLAKLDIHSPQGR